VRGAIDGRVMRDCGTCAGAPAGRGWKSSMRGISGQRRRVAECVRVPGRTSRMLGNETLWRREEAIGGDTVMGEQGLGSHSVLYSV
jgi:hypothetical protein